MLPPLPRFKPRTPKRPLEVPITSLLSSYDQRIGVKNTYFTFSHQTIKLCKHHIMASVCPTKIKGGCLVSCMAVGLHWTSLNEILIENANSLDNQRNWKSVLPIPACKFLFKKTGHDASQMIFIRKARVMGRRVEVTWQVSWFRIRSEKAFWK